MHDKKKDFTSLSVCLFLPMQEKTSFKFSWKKSVVSDDERDLTINHLGLDQRSRQL
jgi:hypothetical protein